MRKPVVFGRSKVRTEITVVKILAVHLLVVIPVFILDPVHGGVQLFQQVGTIPVHRVVKRSRSYLANRYGSACVTAFLNECAYVQINIAPAQFLQGIPFPAGQFHKFCFDAVFFCPGKIQIFLDAAFVHSDPFSVKGSVVIKADGLVVVGNKNIILLFSHGQGRIQHVLRPFFRMGDIAEQVDFTLLQHLQQFRPACLNVFILPARIGSDFLLVFIGITGPSAIGIRYVEGRFVPAYPYGLFPLFRRKNGHGNKNCQQKAEAEAERQYAFFAYHGRRIRHDQLPVAVCKRC